MNESYRQMCQMHAAHHFQAAESWSHDKAYDVQQGKNWARLARFWATHGDAVTACDKAETYLKAEKHRSKWQLAVVEYALELLDTLREEEVQLDFVGGRLEWRRLHRTLLNGADSWYKYSWGGASLCYNDDIAARLCTPSEYKKKKGGMLNPNSNEQWPDAQCRALIQAEARLMRALVKVGAITFTNIWMGGVWV